MRGNFAASGGDIQGDQTWIESELSACKFKDARLGKRLRELIRRMSGKVGGVFRWRARTGRTRRRRTRFSPMKGRGASEIGRNLGFAKCREFRSEERRVG